MRRASMHSAKPLVNKTLSEVQQKGLDLSFHSTSYLVDFPSILSRKMETTKTQSDAALQFKIEEMYIIRQDSDVDDWSKRIREVQRFSIFSRNLMKYYFAASHMDTVSEPCWYICVHSLSSAKAMLYFFCRRNIAQETFNRNWSSDFSFEQRGVRERGCMF